MRPRAGTRNPEEEATLLGETVFSFVAGRNNKQPANSFNKQIPVGISHEAEGPQLECSQGPAVVHYT